MFELGEIRMKTDKEYKELEDKLKKKEIEAGMQQVVIERLVRIKTKKPTSLSYYRVRFAR